MVMIAKSRISRHSHRRKCQLLIHSIIIEYKIVFIVKLLVQANITPECRSPFKCIKYVLYTEYNTYLIPEKYYLHVIMEELLSGTLNISHEIPVRSNLFKKQYYIIETNIRDF